jgi:hypothetical protein
MNKFDVAPTGPRRLSPVAIASVLILYGLAESASAAGVSGRVVDDEGRVLTNVPVCLKQTGPNRECLDIQLTDRDGEYRFRGRKLSREYAIEIFKDTRGATRQYNLFRNYSWKPTQQTAVLTQREGHVQLEPFVGQFDFRNFQHVVHLTASDFPELAEFDLQGEHVMLKVTHAAAEATQPPNTIFLGHVTDASAVSLEASLPSATNTIDYEIYTVGRSVIGQIQLSVGKAKPGRKSTGHERDVWGDK